MRYEMVCLRISIIMPKVIYAFAITFYEVKFISLSHPSYVISCIIIPFHWPFTLTVKAAREDEIFEKRTNVEL